MTRTLLIGALLVAPPLTGGLATTRRFSIDVDAEVVAAITARCARCDWGSAGREAALLALSVDGHYSQHLALTRGGQAATYRVMLGALKAGTHQLGIRRDEGRSAPDADAVTIEDIRFEPFAASSPEHEWLAEAPFLRARPGTVEHFSDFPLLMYVERDVKGETGSAYRFQYTAIFTNEDGGTPTDRLMATWGRTTDIEFVYGVSGPDQHGSSRRLIQAQGHRWVDFAGPRIGTHPVLWVATDNNMVADHGPDGLVTFAPAPRPFSLKDQSREAVMDAEPWTYAVTSAEMLREGRIDPTAPAGSGTIPDPRRYATVEACADVANATLAFDIGLRGADGQIRWYGTDRGDPAFRIARGGCFRGGAPLPDGASPKDIASLRLRAYPRPPATLQAPSLQDAERAALPNPGHVVLRKVNRIFILDARFTPSLAPLRWTGELPVPLDGKSLEVPVAVPRHIEHRPGA